MTPAQLQAARAMLNWTKSELANRAEVRPMAIEDFERGVRVDRHDVARIRAALTVGGVTFLDRGSVSTGAGVALKA